MRRHEIFQRPAQLALRGDTQHVVGRPARQQRRHLLRHHLLGRLVGERHHFVQIAQRLHRARGAERRLLFRQRQEGVHRR